MFPAANRVQEVLIVVGGFLQMNPKTERFIDNDAANKRLTREYRKPYVVPEKV